MEPPEEAEETPQTKLESEKPAPVSSRPPTPPSFGPAYSNFQVDSFKLMELLGPEKVDPADVKLVKDKLFRYSTFWVTEEEPFGDLGEGVLFVGNLRGNREEVFAKLQSQLVEVIGDKYNLFMVEDPNSEGPDPHGGPRVSFGLLQKEVSEPGPTTLWQYVIALLLFLITIGSSVELGIASQINSLPPEVVKYFTDPNAVEAPDMELLFPFVDSAFPLAYGVLGVLLFHEVGHFLAVFPKKVTLTIPYFIPNITLGSFGAITQVYIIDYGLAKKYSDLQTYKHIPYRAEMQLMAPSMENLLKNPPRVKSGKRGRSKEDESKIPPPPPKTLCGDIYYFHHVGSAWSLPIFGANQWRLSCSEKSMTEAKKAQGKAKCKVQSLKKALEDAQS
ncbi:probable zinc metalloprotease EGY1, chloroplastic [Humulus lupulus]|uniref:probable zinc metalloprotease EGY1, chloroplastic n=1 Tax=Humulus lupulus TaxID=3486 RepID=UPI002B4154C6|nr:probable zinc metalloprotease EGY1, chloroplastic [Humulus lupulus]